MRTWVLGDSIVNRAGQNNTQLHGGGDVDWFGQPGGKCIGLVNRVLFLMRKRPFPTTLIIHVGTNDILSSPTWDIRQRVFDNLTGLREILPNTRIIWSDIILRLGYAEEVNRGAGKKCMRNINKYAHMIIKKEMGGNAHIVVHSGNFTSNRRNENGRPIYQYDCVHPSPFGLLVFKQTLSNALVHFNNRPQSVVYPPGALGDEV